MSEIDVRNAIRKALVTERNAMYFYRFAATQAKDADARRVFEILAREEGEHAGHFYSRYTGTDIPSLETFLNDGAGQESDWLASVNRTAGEELTEQKALELAMEKETALEKTLLETAARIPDPDVRSIFELNARETRNHYTLIESEYARVMGMVHESDMDIYVRE